jgi:hypothetical protein
MHEFLLCFPSFTAVYEVTRKGGSNLKGVFALTTHSFYSTGRRSTAAYTLDLVLDLLAVTTFS